MKPFDQYPTDEAVLLKYPGDASNCRHGWGLSIQKLTRQSRCAYCGLSLVNDYHHWLLMSVDHVIPKSEAAKLGIPPELAESLANLVLACSGCNGLGNRFAIAEEEAKSTWTTGDFLKLRDETFVKRKAVIAECRAKEMAFFDSKPWEA